MADDLIPPQIRNGGAGSQGLPGVTAPDYRQVQAPEQVRTDLPDNGAAMRAAALANAFKEFEGLGHDVYTQAATRAGALAGAAAGATGHPQYKQGLERFLAYGRAFNHAATGSYAIEAEAQADDAAARLRVQANNNPDTFRATFTAVRDAVLKNAPADAVPMLTELYNRRLAMTLGAISGDQAQEIQKTQRQTYEWGIQKQTSRVANLQGSADANDQLLAKDEQVKLSLLIDGGVHSGLYSEAEAQAMHINAARVVTKQVFETQLDRELADPNGQPTELLERFRRAHMENLANPNEPPILSEDEYNQLMSNGKQKILQERMNQTYTHSQAKMAEEERFEKGDKLYTFKYLTNDLTLKDLATAVGSGDLRPERATALRNMLEMGAAGAPTKSNPAALYGLLHDPNFLDLTGDQIAAYPGLSTQDKLSAVREQDKRLASWENTQSVKNARGAIDLALKIPPGTERAMLSPEENKARDAANQEFIRLMTAEDPAKRDSTAGQHAQEAVTHIQKQLAVDKVAAYTRTRQTFISSFGPGSAAPMDKDKYEARLKQYEDWIAEQQAIVNQK